MRQNLPVTNIERVVQPNEILVSKTNLKGVITYTNRDFCNVAEFTREEMYGKPHNLIRHPDVPPLAFGDLWERIEKGHPWRGMVKNRNKSGGFYWVDAQVAAQYKDGKIASYISVRRPPSREAIKAAEGVYKALNSLDQKAGLPKPNAILQFFRGLSIRARVVSLFVYALCASLVPLVGFFLGLSTEVRIYTSAAMGVFILPLGYWVAASILKPLEEALSAVQDMARSDFSNPLDVRGSTEMGQLLESVQLMNTNVSGLVLQMTESARDLNAGSKNLAEASHNLSVGVEEVSQQTANISAAANQMDQNLQVVSSSVEEMSISIGEVASKASEGAKISKEAKEIAHEAQGRVRELGQGAESIGKVIQMISKIAEQTNMLALNASIEAAGAGEAGKGFAVVAQEVKDLARQTAASTEDIRKQIHGIQKSTEATVESIESIAKIIDQVNDGNIGIASAVEEQSMTTKEIANNVSQISEASGEINKNISGISVAVTSNAKDAASVSNASNGLQGVADLMTDVVGEFRIVQAK